MVDVAVGVGGVIVVGVFVGALVCGLVRFGSAAGAVISAGGEEEDGPTTIGVEEGIQVAAEEGGAVMSGRGEGLSDTRDFSSGTGSNSMGVAAAADELAATTSGEGTSLLSSSSSRSCSCSPFFFSSSSIVSNPSTPFMNSLQLSFFLGHSLTVSVNRRAFAISICSRDQCGGKSLNFAAILSSAS